MVSKNSTLEVSSPHLALPSIASPIAEPNQPFDQEAEKSTWVEDEDEEDDFDLDFLEVMDKAMSDSELQRDRPSAYGSEAPSVKLVHLEKGPVVIEDKPSIVPADQPILIDQVNNILKLLNNSLDSLAADDKSKQNLLEAATLLGQTTLPTSL